jgi:hypothetical protein
MKTQLLTALLLTTSLTQLPNAHAQETDLGTMSYNQGVQVLPAPGPVTIDGKDNDWDLSAGVWSYNDPTIVNKYSLWTHMMWDAKGIYFLARYHDPTPMQNTTQGKDFARSWKADAYQARVILDDKTPDEHQMHINVFYSTPEQKPYLIVKHGGFGRKPQLDATGEDRPDQLEKYGTTMDAFGGKIAFAAWPDGKGYNAEAFWPWQYLRTSGQPLKIGESFVFGMEAMWGNADGTQMNHRLADLVNKENANRIFMFRARSDWGKAVIAPKGNLNITAEQKALQAGRLKAFVDYDTYGSIPIEYTLPSDRDVTVAIENAAGERVRNLFGQYPRPAGKNVEHWDGLDDKGNPVPPGEYSAIIVDHEPVKVKLVNSVYNAGTPPWKTETGGFAWGSNHGHPTSIATRGDIVIGVFTGTEGTSGVVRADENGIIKWTNVIESQDVTIGRDYVYALSREGWTKRVLVRRINLETGLVIPFEDANRSTEIAVLNSTEGVKDDSSIALQNNRLFALVQAENKSTLFILDPTTGAFTTQDAPAGLQAVTDRDEKMYGLFTDGSVYRLNDKAEKGQKIFSAKGVMRPMRLGVSHDEKRFAISDTSTNQVFVFDASGKKLQEIGKPYQAVNNERPAGKYIETDFIRPLGLDFDSDGRLWVAEGAKTSKRVTTWSPTGQLVQQFWGSADYGAMAGFPVTYDSSRFIAHGVEFQLDPNPDPWKRPTAEKPLLFHPALAEERGIVYRYKGHDYAATVPGYNKPQGFLIAVRDASGVFVPRVRVTYARAKTPGTAWIDRNANGKEDDGETVSGVQGRNHYWSAGWMRPDLTLVTPDSLVFPLQSVTPQGVPVYDFAHPQTPPNAVAFNNRANASSTLVMDNEGNLSTGITFRTVSGRKGDYPNLYGRHDAPAAQRGVLIAPFRTNGVVENVPGVGAITAIGGDRGEWFLISMDGLYLSSMLQDIKGDVTLDETLTGGESFGGFLWRDEKDRILAQLGGMSYRIVEVQGLETTRRSVQKLSVTAPQITEGVRIASTRKGTTATEPEQLEISRVAELPAAPIGAESSARQPLITGASEFRVQEAGNPSRWFRASLAHDGKDLAIAFQVADPSPWKNGEGRFTHAFIGGDAVDVQLDVPGRGPIRLLVAPQPEGDVAVYWQSKAATPENPQTYVVNNNPAAAVKFDVVKRLNAARVQHRADSGGYTILIKVPLAELGLDAANPGVLKGLVGVIFSDPSGTNRAARLYWHNKTTDMVSDVPTESRLATGSWGSIVLK